MRGFVKNNRSRSRKRLVPADNVGLKSKQWGLLTRNLVLAVRLVDPLSHHSYFAFEIPLLGAYNRPGILDLRRLPMSKYFGR